MAVTSLWPIKGRVDQVINYARNPEKTHDRKSLSSFHEIEGVIEYAADEMKTETRAYVHCINLTSEDDAAKEFMAAKDLYGKKDGRVCYHGYQSFKADEVDAYTAHEIGKALAMELWGDRFQVLIATHCNTGHCHNHFVINSVSDVDGKKYYNSFGDYKRMREVSDRLCREYGLSVIENPSGRGKNYQEYLAEKNGKPTNRSLIRKDIDRAVKASMTEKEFYRNLEAMGYDIRLYGENGKPVKYPALRPPGAKGFFRFHKLAEKGYTLEEIREKIAFNYHRTIPFPEDELQKAREYRKITQPHVKLKGLQALYIRYCYELHIIQKYPASAKRVSFFMREDLRRLEMLDKQTRFLADNGIDTIHDLHLFRSESDSNFKSFDRLRMSLRNELKKATRAADDDEIQRLKERIADTTEEMRKIKRSLSLCDTIEARSKPMEEELQKLAEDQVRNDREEERRNEQQFRGRRGTGRADEPGRY